MRRACIIEYVALEHPFPVKGHVPLSSDASHASLQMKQGGLHLCRPPRSSYRSPAAAAAAVGHVLRWFLRPGSPCGSNRLRSIKLDTLFAFDHGALFFRPLQCHQAVAPTWIAEQTMNVCNHTAKPASSTMISPSTKTLLMIHRFAKTHRRNRNLILQE